MTENRPSGQTSHELATFFLQDSGLSDWQMGFLGVALEEVAEERLHRNIPGPISCADCVLEITQMNSQHRGSTKTVVHALTGWDFRLSWSGTSGPFMFFLEHQERRKPMEIKAFHALSNGCGWGSNAHRQALTDLWRARA
jgi:hypothetical protein